MLVYCTGLGLGGITIVWPFEARNFWDMKAAKLPRYSPTLRTKVEINKEFPRRFEHLANLILKNVKVVLLLAVQRKSFENLHAF